MLPELVEVGGPGGVIGPMTTEKLSLPSVIDLVVGPVNVIERFECEVESVPLMTPPKLKLPVADDAVSVRFMVSVKPAFVKTAGLLVGAELNDRRLVAIVFDDPSALLVGSLVNTTPPAPLVAVTLLGARSQS